MAETAGEELFGSQVNPQPCSWLECLAGHRWPPTVIVAKCGGCGGPMIAIQQQSCPFCNEPVRWMNFRADVVPVGSGVAPRCRGVKPPGETLDLHLERHGHEEAMAGFQTYTQKEAQKEARSGKEIIGGQASSGNLG